MENRAKTFFFVVKVPAGQEANIAFLLRRRAKEEGIRVKSILGFDKLKGFLFVEADHVYQVRKLISRVPRVRMPLGVGPAKEEDIVDYITRIPEKLKLKPGDIVKISDGLFKGALAKVKSVDEERGMVSVELMDTESRWDLSVGIDHVKLEKRGEEVGEEKGD